MISNAPSGTVIDNTVTKDNKWEFYLISQEPGRATAIPTHYTVLFDSIGCSPIDVHSLCYKLCYNYYNVSGAIRVPAPIQYAHRLCNQVGQIMKEGQAPHSHLSENLASLFFI